MTRPKPVLKYLTNLCLKSLQYFSACHRHLGRFTSCQDVQAFVLCVAHFNWSTSLTVHITAHILSSITKFTELFGSNFFKRNPKNLRRRRQLNKKWRKLVQKALVKSRQPIIFTYSSKCYRLFSCDIHRNYPPSVLCSKSIVYWKKSCLCLIYSLHLILWRYISGVIAWKMPYLLKNSY